jgi:hypothetical protein
MRPQRQRHGVPLLPKDTTRSLVKHQYITYYSAWNQITSEGLHLLFRANWDNLKFLYLRAIQTIQTAIGSETLDANISQRRHSNEFRS